MWFGKMFMSGFEDNVDKLCKISYNKGEETIEIKSTR